MNEGAGGNELGTLGICKLLRSHRRREAKGKDKESNATPKAVPSMPPRTKMAMPRQNLFTGLLCGLSLGCFQAKGERSGDAER
jgi:hypothetical protein